MKYFSGLTFRTFQDEPDYKVNFFKKSFKYYGIQYNHAGKLVFSINDGNPVTVDGANAFISFPGQSYSYGAPFGESRHHCYICFYGPLVKRYMRDGLFVLNRKKPLIPILNPMRFYSSMCELMQFLSQPGGYSEARAVHMLEGILLQLHEQTPKIIRHNIYCEQRIQSIYHSITDMPMKEWNFRNEAKALSISYSHFRRIFREVTGYAPHRHLLLSRLNLAALKICSTSLPIKQIAEGCGFSDEFYFSRLFKQYKSMSPQIYRKSARL